MYNKPHVSSVENTHTNLHLSRTSEQTTHRMGYLITLLIENDVLPASPPSSGNAAQILLHHLPCCGERLAAVSLEEDFLVKGLGSPSSASFEYISFSLSATPLKPPPPYPSYQISLPLSAPGFPSHSSQKKQMPPAVYVQSLAPWTTPHWIQHTPHYREMKITSDTLPAADWSHHAIHSFWNSLQLLIPSPTPSPKTAYVTNLTLLVPLYYGCRFRDIKPAVHLPQIHQKKTIFCYIHNFITSHLDERFCLGFLLMPQTGSSPELLHYPPNPPTHLQIPPDPCP